MVSENFDKPSVMDEQPHDGSFDDVDPLEGQDDVVGDNQDGLSPHQRFLPIEADEARRRAIESDEKINTEHLGTLAGLILLLNSDEEKKTVSTSAR